MPFGMCSSAQRSLVVLLPSTWAPAVAQPQRNFSGKDLDLSGTGCGAEEAWSAFEWFGTMARRAAAEAPCRSERRESDVESGGSGRSDCLKWTSARRDLLRRKENTSSAALM